MPGDGKGLAVIVEAFRRAMLEVLVPEIRTMQKQLDEHSGILKELRQGQQFLLDRMDVVQQVARLESRLERLEKSSA